MGQIEIIDKDGAALCYLIRGSMAPEETTFITPPEFKQQVGFVAYRAGSEIPRHEHVPLERHLVGTAEVLVVRRGRCLMDIFDDDRKRIATREIVAGDVVLLVGGGHGFRILEDTLFLEVKQGPYLGLEEKIRF
jgi:hypothetical protein